MLTLLAAGAALTALFLLLIAIRIAIREQLSGPSMLFAFSALSLSLWMAARAMTLLGPADLSDGWSSAVVVSALCGAAAIFHYSRAVTRRRKDLRLALAITWPVTLFLATAMIGFGVVSPQGSVAWGPVPPFRWWVAPAIGWTAFLVLRSIIRITRELETAEAGQDRRGRSLRLVIALGALAGIDFLPGFGTPIPPLGFVFAALAGTVCWRMLDRYTRLTELKPSFEAPQILGTMQGAVIATDLDGAVVLTNDAASRLLEYTEEQLLETNISDIIATPFNIGTASDTLMRGLTIRDRAMLWRTRDQQLVEVSVSGSLLRDADGIPSGVVYVASDITAKEKARQIEYQAFHDPLTGLPNRTMLRTLLDNAIEDFNVLGGGAPAVLFLDLDGFKLVNDSLGHSAGDRLLQAVAAGVRRILADSDIIGRLGGDEFLFILRVGDVEQAKQSAERILEAVQQRVALHGQEISVTGSIGIALYPVHGSDSESLMKNADTAMYASKEAGKNQIAVCGPEMSRRASHRFTLEARIREAVANESFELHYQPIVRLADNTIVGAEALIRLRYEDELLYPAEFLPVAEEIGLINEIGEWTMFTSCREASRWERDCGQPLQLSLNLAAEQLGSTELTVAVTSALQFNDVAPERLILEITESAAMRNIDLSHTILSALRDIGIRVAIDDFGTGYSSLGYLQQLPIDYLKIDASFIRGIGVSHSSTAIVTATLALAHALELGVIAEGIERLEQLDFLGRSTCDKAQGFAWSPPIPPDELCDWLSNASAPLVLEPVFPQNPQPAV